MKSIFLAFSLLFLASCSNRSDYPVLETLETFRVASVEEWGRGYTEYSIYTIINGGEQYCRARPEGFQQISVPLSYCLVLKERLQLKNE